MTPDEPTTRTEANQPEAVDHLSTPEQTALELSTEAEHTDGPTRERLTQEARQLTSDDKENDGK